MLFRKFVSRNAAKKGRAVLEGVGLSSVRSNMCYTNHSANEEEAVQTGLIEWRNGGGNSPTWAVLVNAMEHAEIPVPLITKLKEELLKGAHSQLIMLTRACMHMLHCIVPIHMGSIAYIIYYSNYCRA